MDLSFWPLTSQSWPDLLAGAQHADDTGWHAVYVADHFMGVGAAGGRTHWREATAQIAALAAATSRVRLSPLVLSATYRHPAVVANWAVAVDQISGGRLTLGLGAGWQENEHEQYGIDLGTPGERRRRFEEYLQVVRGLLDDEVTNFEGEWYQLRDARCDGEPVQARLPILVGAKGRADARGGGPSRRRVEHVEPSGRHGRRVGGPRSPLRRDRSRSRHRSGAAPRLSCSSPTTGPRPTRSSSVPEPGRPSPGHRRSSPRSWPSGPRQGWTRSSSRTGTSVRRPARAERMDALREAVAGLGSLGPR